jgi:hypothetical protein
MCAINNIVLEDVEWLMNYTRGTVAIRIRVFFVGIGSRFIAPMDPITLPLRTTLRGVDLVKYDLKTAMVVASGRYDIFNTL